MNREKLHRLTAPAKFWALIGLYESDSNALAIVNIQEDAGEEITHSSYSYACKELREDGFLRKNRNGIHELTEKGEAAAENLIHLVDLEDNAGTSKK